jgi:predicted dehydrogenase
MTRSIRWGILSTANIADKRVVPAMQKAHNATVQAVASRSLDRAQDFADRHSIPAAYGNYDDLLKAGDVDAIYIGLPNSLHAEWAMKCATSKKPTLCEKPLAANAPEAQEMVNAFATHDVLFAEAFMYRFHPQTQRVKALLDEGAVGQVQVINATFTFSVRDDSNIRLQKELAGGALMDVGCYCVNTMRHFTGEEPQTVQAFADFGDDTDVDERITGILQFPSGVLGHFDASLRTHRTHTYEIRGTTGRILVEEAYVPDLTPDTVTRIHHWQGDDYRQIEIPGADHYQLMVEDFGEALLEERPPRFSPQDAVGNMQAIDALLTRARENEA